MSNLFLENENGGHCTPMASTVPRSQSSRAPLRFGETGDSHYEHAADKTAATMLF